MALGRAAGPPRLAGDHAFASLADFPGRAPVPAAVLVPVLARPEPTVLLTRRTAHLKHHAGQVAFPGGRIDPGDPGPVAAALREAQEEVGLPPDRVDVLGLSDPYVTATGYRVHPVVGVVDPGVALRPNVQEVAELFEVPLAHVLDPSTHQLREAEWQGRIRRFYVIEWQGRTIWGATAGMLVNLAARLP
ncbi:MAG: CoA pyrophosphatase [Sphingomonadaceae bacterium]|nr:CoA pyrophosphatase [Sphingomonadaceae bacterium]MDW8414666.1 CoA pyrophosphatase [Thermaurantiacus sp.]